MPDGKVSPVQFARNWVTKMKLDLKPKIKVLPKTILIGMRAEMCISKDKTRELWHQFMPKRNQIQYRVNPKLYYSMRKYSGISYFQDFSPETLFEKWAAVEVRQVEKIPENLEKHVLTGGKYAVFIHKGPANRFPQTMEYIFRDWLPGSKYELDDREHFEILKANYQPDDPDAEEEVWVPIKSGSGERE